MRQLGKLLEEEVDGHDGDLVAIREMYALERTMLFREGVDSLIREVIDAHKPYSTQLLQA